jgi:hypothetical protein
MDLYQIRVSNGEFTLISEADLRELSRPYGERFVSIQPLNADGSPAGGHFMVNPDHVVHAVKYP